MKRAILAYNPFSGNQSINQKLDYIIEKFQEKNILLQPYRIQYDKSELLDSILRENDFEFIISSGGDGTLNYISNIILKGGIDIPMGIIPAGTCNDFASILNIPIALDECLDIILNGKIIEVDAGIINEEKYFLSSCAGGVLVGVSYNTQGEHKKNFGPLAYYFKALSEVANIKPHKLTIITENETLKEDILLFIILNGKQAGGFNNILKDADISDGLMDIVIIKNCSHIDLAGVFFNIVNNDDLNNKYIKTLKANTCKIKGSDGIDLSIDGEKGPKLPVTIRVINKGIKVFV